MAAYNLKVSCFDQAYTLPVFPGMILTDITAQVRVHFTLPTNSCELEIFDEAYQSYFDFDENCFDEILRNLPHDENRTLLARVVLPRIDVLQASKYQSFKLSEQIDEPFYTIDASEPSSLSQGEGSLATSDSTELPRTQMDIDGDIFLSLQLLMPSATNSSDLMKEHQRLNHLRFERDVAPYQNDGSSIGIDSDNEQCTQRKSVCIRPLQGLKTNLSERQSTCVPEIKVYSQPIKAS